jgi:hypothetical protein
MAWLAAIPGSSSCRVADGAEPRTMSDSVKISLPTYSPDLKTKTCSGADSFMRMVSAIVDRLEREVTERLSALHHARDVRRLSAE